VQEICVAMAPHTPRFLLVVALAALSAQVDGSMFPIVGGAYTLDVETSDSQFIFGGTCSLGPIEGNPFNMDGAVAIEINATHGRIIEGNLYPVDTVTFSVPNVFAFLPPLLTGRIENAKFNISSNGTFDIAPVGGTYLQSFMSKVILTPIGGTLTVTPFVGEQMVLELTDLPANDPSTSPTISGTIRVPDCVGSSLADLRIPVDLSLAADDGDFWFDADMDGDLVAVGDVCISEPSPEPTPVPCADNDAKIIQLASGAGVMVSGCADVKSFCEHPTYGSVVQETCPPSCGLCTLCADDDAKIVMLASSVGLTISGCAQVTSFCGHPMYGDTVIATCPASCGKCARRLADRKHPDADELDWIEELTVSQSNTHLFYP
jgi:hypothetical protein